jgi:hypothetical protein
MASVKQLRHSEDPYNAWNVHINADIVFPFEAKLAYMRGDRRQLRRADL